MSRKLDLSHSLQQRAETFFPGGVNSPVRAFRAVGGEPPLIVSGRARTSTDADGNRYLDYVLSWGPLILGHAHPPWSRPCIEAARKGTSFGASTPAEADLAEEVIRALPSIEKLRFVSSGTEATMTRHPRGARLHQARLHRQVRGLLPRPRRRPAGQGRQRRRHLRHPRLGRRSRGVRRNTLTLPYNDVAALEAAFAVQGPDRRVIVEPVVGNMGCVPPEPGFLEAIRAADPAARARC